jgi:hypothetical protein
VAWTNNQIGGWRARAKARGRRTEYLARAYRCGDMAVRAGDGHDAQFLRAMTIVWQVFADQVFAEQVLAEQVLAEQVLADGGHKAADAPGSSNSAQMTPSARGTI